MLLDLFYLAAFGGALVAPVLLGAAWVLIRLARIPPGPVRLNLYRGAVLASPFLPVIAYLLVKEG